MDVLAYIRTRIEALETLARRTAVAAAAATNNIQSGSTQLVNGLTPNIPARITANSVIVCSLKTPNGNANTVEYSPFAAGRSVGDPGFFAIEALAAGGGGNVADGSTIDWIIVG